MSLQAKLESLKNETMEKIDNVNDLQALNQIRVETLGKKAQLQKFCGE